MRPDSRLLDHALTIVEAMIDDGCGRPLTICEKLACRVLLPHVERRELVQFCRNAEGANPMYRRALMEAGLAVIRRGVAAGRA